jgi:GT2 family glycosyltransferase
MAAEAASNSQRGENVGVVAIGRNEGERLRRCLESVVRDVRCAVYVDSGSTDDSVAIAMSLGVDVVMLDVAQAFTAARARNAGIDRLTTHWPGVEFVQVVDGDCELIAGWIESAMQFMHTYEKAAIVCGRRREREPDATVYNRLCDLEWDTPVGEAKACGGDALIRLEAFQAVHGFNPTLIAGEEPELCVRVRGAGWTVHRIDHDMTWHDAQMRRFGQWWKRAVRAGHAYAEGAALHGSTPEKHWVREVRSAWFWGVLLWLIALAAVPLTYGLSLLLLAAYGVLYWRVYGWGMRRGWPKRLARLYATYTMLSKLPQCVGQATYWLNRLRGRRTRLMEYKEVGPRPSAVGAGDNSQGPSPDAQGPAPAETGRAH